MFQNLIACISLPALQLVGLYCIRPRCANVYGCGLWNCCSYERLSTVLLCDLALLQTWSVHWQLKFNISNCKHGHFGPVHQFGSYYLKGIMIDCVESQKGLGILFNHQLKFHSHTSDVAAKANCLLGLFMRSFDYLDSGMWIKWLVTLVRPILEYCNSVWRPSFVLDQRKIEKVQCRATRLLLSIKTSFMRRDSWYCSYHP